MLKGLRVLHGQVLPQPIRAAGKLLDVLFCPQRGKIPHCLGSLLVAGHASARHHSTQKASLSDHDLRFLGSKRKPGHDAHVQKGFQTHQVVQNMPRHLAMALFQVLPERFIVRLRRDLHFQHPLDAAWLFHDVVNRTLPRISVLRSRRNAARRHRPQRALPTSIWLRKRQHCLLPGLTSAHGPTLATGTARIATNLDFAGSGTALPTLQGHQRGIRSTRAAFFSSTVSPDHLRIIRAAGPTMSRLSRPGHHDSKT